MTNNDNNMQERESIYQRETEYDLLRLLALLCVISVHCTGMGGSDLLPTSNPSRQALILFDTVVTWQIPVYVMISGRFFLDPERNISQKKLCAAIGRLIIAFLFWDIIYQLFYCFSGSYSGLNWKGVLMEAVQGPYHFWYIYMLVCLYAIVPFLRMIAESRRLMEYYLALFFVFSCLYGYGSELPFIGNIISSILTKTNFHFAVGYSGYFVLGWYIKRYGSDISPKKEWMLYGCALLLAILVSAFSLRRACIEGTYGEWYTGYLKPNIILVATGVFMFFTRRVSRLRLSQNNVRIISAMTTMSFGIYLVHALLLDCMDLIGLSPVIANPWIMQPIIVFLSFALSGVAVYLIRKIPYWGTKIC